MVVLGIIIQNHFSFKPYIDCIMVSCCAQTFFALMVLRSNGLSGNALWDVWPKPHWSTRCCKPLWWGFIVASYKQRLQSVLNKAVKLGFVSKTQAALSELCGHADHALFPTSVITTIMFYITFNHLSRWLATTWEDQLGIDLSSLRMRINNLIRKTFHS